MRRARRARRGARRHVRYFTPFGHAGDMPRRQAKWRLKADMQQWKRFEANGRLTPELLRLGPPRIERVR